MRDQTAVVQDGEDLLGEGREVVLPPFVDDDAALEVDPDRVSLLDGIGSVRELGLSVAERLLTYHAAVLERVRHFTHRA